MKWSCIDRSDGLTDFIDEFDMQIDPKLAKKIDLRNTSFLLNFCVNFWVSFTNFWTIFEYFLTNFQFISVNQQQFVNQFPWDTSAAIIIYDDCSTSGAVSSVAAHSQHNRNSRLGRNRFIESYETLRSFNDIKIIRFFVHFLLENKSGIFSLFFCLQRECASPIEQWITRDYAKSWIQFQPSQFTRSSNTIDCIKRWILSIIN